MKFFSSALHVAALLLTLDTAKADAVTTSSTAAASSVLSTLKSIDYRYFVAGGTCAAISHGITTPIDVVKTRIQAEPKKFDKGMTQATVAILKEDGPEALLGGLGPTVVGYGIEGTCRAYSVS